MIQLTLKFNLHHCLGMELGLSWGFPVPDTTSKNFFSFILNPWYLDSQNISELKVQLNVIEYSILGDAMTDTMIFRSYNYDNENNNHNSYIALTLCSIYSSAIFIKIVTPVFSRVTQALLDFAVHYP